ncbi:MAG: hypothetical protein ACI8SR_002604 [Oceanicoccus sp.]
MKIYFDVQELYYLPQYMPIKKELDKHGIWSVFVLYSSIPESVPSILIEAGVSNESIERVDRYEDAIALYQKEKPDWLILGNSFDGINYLNSKTKTALVSHGIGPKACYYTVSDTPTDVRFVEGPYRTDRLKKMYPEQTFIDTGYAKLDPAINGELSDLHPSSYGLDDNKMTILYAPTFYPSSIERFSRSFPDDFKQYNIILKPHYFSLSIDRYRKQKALLEYWAGFDNVYLACSGESNILPFMSISDVLISDASSTLFEFTALDKPVVWCDFLKLRWGYRGLFKFRFKQRMDQDLYKYADIAVHAKSYSQLRKIVDEQIAFPGQYASQRAKYTLPLVGIVDGKASERIVEYMLQTK